MSDFISYKTSSPAGDMLTLLPSIRQVYRLTGKKAIIYQALNVVAEGHPSIPQPFTNKNGQSIMMGSQTFQKIIPLLKNQSYIEGVTEYTGQPVDYDLDEIRFKTFTNQAVGSLHRVTFYVFPEMACDLSEKYIELDSDKKDVTFFDKIIINFTPRFRNPWVNYFFLKEHQHRLIFAGLEKERDDFCKLWGLDIFHHEFQDFYELAKAIYSCKLFLSNQTSFFQIAEGLKTKRLLETCPQLAHVIPMGANGFDYYHQPALELYFNKLINEKN